MRVVDVVLGPTSSVRLHGKGRKQRTLPLWKTTAKAIRDWLELNPNLQANSPLLPRRDGMSMTRANVAQRLKLAVDVATRRHPELAKISVSPHVIRHSTAMSLLQSGADPLRDRPVARAREPINESHVRRGRPCDEGALSCSIEGAGHQAGPVPTTEGLAGVPAGTLIMRSGDR